MIKRLFRWKAEKDYKDENFYNKRFEKLWEGFKKHNPPGVYLFWVFA